MLTDEVLDYAEHHESVELLFQKHEVDRFGWHAHVHSSNDSCLLAFPWGDNFDQALITGPETLPFGTALEDVWQDEDEGWHAEVALVGSLVFVAESYERPYLLVPNESGTGGVGNYWDIPTVRPVPGTTKGRVRINDADATIHAVPRQEWDRAWKQAYLSCLDGSPRPSVRDWAETPAHRVE